MHLRPGNFPFSTDLKTSFQGVRQRLHPPFIEMSTPLSHECGDSAMALKPWDTPYWPEGVPREITGHEKPAKIPHHPIPPAELRGDVLLVLKRSRLAPERCMARKGSHHGC
mgnify:CR=1 FL=1